jgi:hypothetical protein
MYGQLYNDVSLMYPAEVTLTWTRYKTQAVPWTSSSDLSGVTVSNNGFVVSGAGEFLLKASVSVYTGQPIQLFFQFLSTAGGNIAGITCSVFGGSRVVSLQKMVALRTGDSVRLGVNLVSLPSLPCTASFYQGAFTIQDLDT